MSRTNPYKKKRRQANKTLLVFGEGLSEEIFLRYLKSIYSYKSNVAITIRRGRGGNAQCIIIDADRTPGAFDRKIVVLDNDKAKIEMIKARQEAKDRNIEMIENTPCLEFLLIEILNKKPIGKNSNWCKKEFESKYLDKKKRGESNEYIKLFPKKLLDTKR
ncbi:MAG: RloB domain-containing protein, partial [Candidatus Paceibacterota bacterium]